MNVALTVANGQFNQIRTSKNIPVITRILEPSLDLQCVLDRLVRGSWMCLRGTSVAYRFNVDPGTVCLSLLHRLLLAGVSRGLQHLMCKRRDSRSLSHPVCWPTWATHPASVCLRRRLHFYIHIYICLFECFTWSLRGFAGMGWILVLILCLYVQHYLGLYIVRGATQEVCSNP